MSVFKMVISAPLLGVFIVSAILVGASAPLPAKKDFCTTDGKGGTVECYCLMYHPDFCTEEGPIPSCCKVTETGTKAHSCHCCPSGKPKTVEEYGSYEHIR